VLDASPRDARGCQPSDFNHHIQRPWVSHQADLNLRVLLSFMPGAGKRAIRQEDRPIFLDAAQWSGQPSARRGGSGKKRRRTDRTTKGSERQSSSQDGKGQLSVILARQPDLPRLLEAWRTFRLAQIGSRTVAHRFGQTTQREMPMKRLITRAMHQPLIALCMFHVIDLMHNVDYSPSSALLVLAAKSMSRVMSLFNKG